MRILVLQKIVVAITLAVSFPYAATAQQEVNEAFQQQLTEKELTQYRKQLDAAQGDQARREIHNEYQKLTQDRSQLKEGRGNGQGQGGANRAKGQGQGNPSKEGKAEPSGSKNKSQKSGR